MKIITIVLLLGVFALPLSASALTQEEVNEQLMATINQLMQQVLILLEKLQAMQTQQAQDSQTLQTVAQQTTPVVVGAASTSSPAPVVVEKANFCEPLKKLDFEDIRYKTNARFAIGYDYINQLSHQTYKIACIPNQDADWIVGCQKFLTDNSSYRACMEN